MKNSNRNARFTILEDADNYILINDIGGNDKERSEWDCISIANDPESVIQRLYEAGHGILKSKRLFYIDTEGRADELRHKNGNFISYVSGFNTILHFNALKHMIEKED